MKLWVPRRTYVPTRAPRYFDRIVRVSYWCNMIKRWEQPAMIVGETDGNRRTREASASRNRSPRSLQMRLNGTLICAAYMTESAGSVLSQAFLLQTIRRSHRRLIDSPRYAYQRRIGNWSLSETLLIPCESPPRVSSSRFLASYRRGFGIRDNFSSRCNYVRVFMLDHATRFGKDDLAESTKRDWTDSLLRTSHAIPLHPRRIASFPNIVVQVAAFSLAVISPFTALRFIGGIQCVMYSRVSIREPDVPLAYRRAC